eukprot:6172718-Pleurochrysis_carterae.AAC.1
MVMVVLVMVMAKRNGDGKGEGNCGSAFVRAYDTCRAAILRAHSERACRRLLRIFSRGMTRGATHRRSLTRGLSPIS